MTAIDTVVIGAGHAGLAVSHLLGRGRVATTSSSTAAGRGELAQRAVGLAPPAHPALDDPAAGLAVHRPRPGGLHGGPASSSTTSSGTPPRAARPLVSGRRGARGVAVPAAATWSPRPAGRLAGATRRDRDRRHRPAAPCPTAIERLDAGHPGAVARRSTATRDQLAAGRRPGRRRLRVGRPDRRRAGARRAGASCWPSAATPGCRAATGAWTLFWWLEQTGRLARLDEARGIDRGRPPRAVAPAGRPGAERPRAGPTWTWTPCRPLGVELVGRLDGVHRHRVDFRHDLARTDRRRPTPACTGFLDEVDAFVDATHLTGEVEAGDPAARRCACGRPRGRLEPARRGHRHRRARHRLPPAPPLAEGPGRRTRRPDPPVRGVTPAPGLYAVGQRFQHRRDSTFIDGARFAARRRRLPPVHRRVRRSRKGRSAMKRLRRRRRGGPGRRRLDRDAAGPGRCSGSRSLDRGRYGTDTLSTHGLMRAGVLQLSRWGLLPRVVGRRHAAGAGTPRSTTPRTTRCGSRSGRAPAWTRSTPRAATCSTGCSSTPPPRPAPHVLHETRVTDVLRDCSGRVSGVRVARRGRHPRPLGRGSSSGADGIASLVAREVGATRR